MTFREWLIKVDSVMVRHFGMGHRDVEDWQWNEYFDDDYSEKEALSMVSDAVADWAYDHGFPGNPNLYLVN